ncbi:MAG: helix-turn-helix domain-containing protein [Chitinophagaceae bacterium]
MMVLFLRPMMKYVIAVGIFQAVMAMVLLQQNKLRHKADSLLILLLACIGTHLTIKFYIFNFVTDDHVRLQMNTFIGFCYAPLAYLYALKVEQPSFIPASRWYVFLPFLLGAVGYLTVVCLLITAAGPGHSMLDLYNDTTTWLMAIVNMFLPVLTLRISKRIKDEYIQEKKLVQRISYFFIFLSIISVFFNISPWLHLHIPNVICRTIVYTGLVMVCILIIRYKYVAAIAIVPQMAVAQTPEAPAVMGDASEITVMEQAEEDPSCADDLTAEVQEFDADLPVRKLHLSAGQHEQIWKKLEAHLEATKLYTDPDISLDKLAAAIGYSKYHLSETLNSYAHKSFYQYINEYRIRRAVELMNNMQAKGLPVNILVIAYDCGFKAKSSFNQYFKKVTGSTPTAYLRSPFKSALSKTAII